MTAITTTCISFPSGPIFPPEITGIIINFAISILDLTDIRNISLCNTTFLDYARKHPEFFAKLKLQSSQLEDFLSFIKDFPESELPRRVKKLTVHAGTSNAQNGDSELLDQFLSRKLFPSVVELTVLGHDEEKIPLKGLGRCIFSGHLSKLVLSNLVLPHNVLMHAFQNVKELSLSNVRCYNVPGTSHRFPPLRTSKLEKLELGPKVDQCIEDLFLHEPQPMARFQNLKHLSLVPYCSHWQFASALLRRLKDTLEYLKITFRGEKDRNDGMKSGVSLPNLTNLSIQLPSASQGNIYRFHCFQGCEGEFISEYFHVQKFLNTL
ncbi:hypothetical protein BDQ17DRAFT_213256 [Cyathus striatus]|nr:hypothetical protein BDQ17DRAFT_213256 [Cyathus striatus]